MVKKATRILRMTINKKVNPRSKRAQIKIQQTAFLLIAVTLFFALAGILVLSFRLSSLKESATMLEEKNALLLVSKLANSPELSCGEAFEGKKIIDCVDADKVMGIKKDHAKYRRFWGVSNIEIRKIYPKLEGEVECSEANYPKECNLIRIWPRVEGENYTSIANYVSLCSKYPKESKVYDKCEIAMLMVDYSKKQ